MKPRLRIRDVVPEGWMCQPEYGSLLGVRVGGTIRDGMELWIDGACENPKG